MFINHSQRTAHSHRSSHLVIYPHRFMMLARSAKTELKRIRSWRLVFPSTFSNRGLSHDHAPDHSAHANELQRRLQYLRRAESQSSGALADVKADLELRSPNTLPSKPRAPGNDKLFIFATLGAIIASPLLVYFWWQHRAEHMQNKKELLLREAQERYRTSAR